MFKGWRVTGTGCLGEETGFTVPADQMPLLRQIARVWADLALTAGAVIDRDRARRDVAHLYHLAGLRPPHSIAFLDGPRDLRRRAAPAAAQAYQGLIRNALITALRPFGSEPEVRYVGSLNGEHHRRLLLLQGMRLAAGRLAQASARRALEEAAGRVENGLPLAEALRRGGCFSPAVIHMVAAGEESGRLPELLKKAAAYQELAARTTMESLAAALEPVTIAGLGVLVAGVILVAFAPLYQMIAAL